MCHVQLIIYSFLQHSKDIIDLHVYLRSANDCPRTYMLQEANKLYMCL